MFTPKAANRAEDGIRNSTDLLSDQLTNRNNVVEGKSINLWGGRHMKKKTDKYEFDTQDMKLMNKIHKYTPIPPKINIKQKQEPA